MIALQPGHTSDAVGSATGRRGLLVTSARLLAVAGLALSMSATPAFAAPSNPPSSGGDTSNNDQAVQPFETILPLPEVTADDLVERHETSAGDQAPSEESVSDRGFAADAP